MQVALFAWAKMAACSLPGLELIFAVPNGGARHVAVAAKLKAEGVKRGVPDVCLPVSRGGYHGLWIELKAPGGRTSEAQDWWIARLLREGYLVQVVTGEWTEAKTIVERYLAGRFTKESVGMTASKAASLGDTV